MVATDGEAFVVVDHGRFVTSWVGNQPLLPEPEASETSTTPATVGVAEELDLVWRFLTSPGTEVVEAAIDPGAIRATGLRWQAAEAALKAS